MNETQRRPGMDQTFYEHVMTALKASGQRHDAAHTFIVAKQLYTNTMIRVGRGKAAGMIENPHYMGRNVDKIADTVKDMAP